MKSIIQSLWIGAAFSNLEKLCVRSFIDNGHEFHLYVYAEVAGVPAGVVVCDANEILSADKIFYHKGGSVAGFADWFRYQLLAERGGWWVDMDVVCLRQFNFGRELVLNECEDGLYTNTIIRAPAGHKLMREMARVCSQHPRRAGSRFGAVGGPRPLSRAIIKLGLQDFGMPYTYYGVGCGWNSFCNKTFASGVAALAADVHSVHFANNSASRNAFDKDARYDEESLYEQLKTKHGIITAPGARRITSAQINAAMIDKRLYKFERRRARKRMVLGIVVVVLIVVGAVVGWWV